MKKIILLIVVTIVALIFYSLFSSDNINSLKGNFIELAFERNENNTGSIHRVYAFSVEDTLWTEMKTHTDLLPHTKYGETEVYYFLEKDSVEIDLKLSLRGINQKVQSTCLAHSIKNGQSSVTLRKYPF